MGEVLLFDIGVVILPVGPGAGEGQAFLLGVAVELIVDEGVIVVRVDPLPGERGSCPDVLDSLEDALLCVLSRENTRKNRLKLPIKIAVQLEPA